MGKDYYGILGLKKDATEEDIRKSYKGLALKYHPDKNKSPGADDKFREIAEAYEVLINKKKRDAYDRHGEDGIKGGGKSAESAKCQDSSFGDGRGAFTQFFSSTSAFQKFFDFGSSASRLFSFHDEPKSVDDSYRNYGGYDMRHGNLRGHSFNLHLNKEKSKTTDMSNEHDLYVSLEEVLTGSTKKVKISRVVSQPDGTLKKEEKVYTVDVQPGWKAGTKVIFQKEDCRGRNQPLADVVFVIRDKPHPDFKRDGSNIKYVAKITLKQALCGCELEVPTLKGDTIILDLKEEILKPHSMKRLSGLGLPHPKEPSKVGDLIVTFDIKFPTSLPRYVKNVLEEIFLDSF